MLYPVACLQEELPEVEDIQTSADAAAGLHEQDLAADSAAQQETKKLQQAYAEQQKAAEGQQAEAHPGLWSADGGMAGMPMQASLLRQSIKTNHIVKARCMLPGPSSLLRNRAATRLGALLNKRVLQCTNRYSYVALTCLMAGMDIQAQTAASQDISEPEPPANGSGSGSVQADGSTQSDIDSVAGQSSSDVDTGTAGTGVLFVTRPQSILLHSLTGVVWLNLSR